ncbi:MAG: Crp/Fnr family transcriptional regulator [Spirochaetae bacterium HGW-Spirochaetae-4]|nr:MAG: Crp/Fnr family transcriptional regulator [Spirochaetae bacterium HGW-Spirochaetae-4]HCG63219.1 Crp/Fnr family transcriptional regulator [Sphaerochaeta sp.]
MKTASISVWCCFCNEEGNNMEPYNHMLMQTPLFNSLTADELPHMLNCLNARKKTYEAKEFIIHETDVTEDLGIVLQGQVQIITEDFLGNRSITAKLGPGQLFGQVAASKKAASSPVSVMADTDSEILLLKFHKLVAPCTRACSFHSRVIENMMNVLSDRNLMMNRKLTILSQRTMRDKLLTFLAWQSQDKMSNEFDIPFNRDELADYLCVNRSALSREISNMIYEGIISSERNHFTLHEKALQ